MKTIAKTKNIKLLDYNNKKNNKKANRGFKKK